MSVIAPYDREALKQQFQSAKPFPFFKVEGFLDASFAKEVVAAYPSFEQARQMGREFKAVNENLKVQVVDYDRFPPVVQRLSDALASPKFLQDLEYVTGIPNIEWDPTFSGGGMHQTASSGWLDVHVDFNFHEQLKMFRRLNILVFLNPDWNPEWGGTLELWDRDVKHRHHAFEPIHNRCVVFETSEISFHGVTPVTCPPDVARRSFAAYYYTREAPGGWAGRVHDTIFKARPEEYVKGFVLMPAEKARSAFRQGVNATKRTVKGLLGRD